MYIRFTSSRVRTARQYNERNKLREKRYRAPTTKYEKSLCIQKKLPKDKVKLYDKCILEGKSIQCYIKFHTYIASRKTER